MPLKLKQTKILLYKTKAYFVHPYNNYITKIIINELNFVKIFNLYYNKFTILMDFHIININTI